MSFIINVVGWESMRQQYIFHAIDSFDACPKCNTTSLITWHPNSLTEVLTIVDGREVDMKVRQAVLPHIGREHGHHGVDRGKAHAQCRLFRVHAVRVPLDAHDGLQEHERRLHIGHAHGLKSNISYS